MFLNTQASNICITRQKEMLLESHKINCLCILILLLQLVHRTLEEHVTRPQCETQDTNYCYPKYQLQIIKHALEDCVAPEVQYMGLDWLFRISCVLCYILNAKTYKDERSSTQICSVKCLHRGFRLSRIHFSS
jgi:hypothetical protein